MGFALIAVFSNHSSGVLGGSTASSGTATTSAGAPRRDAAREPYDYRLMEQRHTQLADKLTEMVESIEGLRQEAIYDQHLEGRKRARLIAEQLEARVAELRKIKSEIDERLSKDRANLVLEVNRLKDERDQAARDGVERRTFILLVGDIAFRIGALVLAIYLSSLLFSTSKYLLRVADHLNSIADSVDLSTAAALSIEGAIRALTPHSIDFHVDDTLTLKSAKDLVAALKEAVPAEPRKSAPT